MLILAEFMGFAEMFCIGMDFCWQDERYTHRVPNPFDEHNRPVEQTFTVLSNTNKVVTTESVYFHAARYMRYKCEELKKSGKKVYQMEEGIDFDTTETLNNAALEKKLKKTPFDQSILKDIPSVVPIKTEEVKKLLLSLKKDKKEKSNRRKANILEPTNALWPFLQEVPLEQRAAMCDRFLNELLVKINN
jgi:hypothetical protein